MAGIERNDLAELRSRYFWVNGERSMRAVAISILTFIALVGGPIGVAATPQEGKDYTVIQSPASTPSPKIVVTEFFSYQCPHCFAFFKPLHDWSAHLPADVQFERKSVSIGHQPWVDIARTYYALQQMGKLDALDAEIFDAIHRQGVRLDSIGLINGWLSKHGIGIMEFDVFYRSAKAREAFEQGEQLAREYKIPSIPTMVIDGKYLVAIASNVSFDRQLAVVDYLIARARQDRTKGKH